MIEVTAGLGKLTRDLQCLYELHSDFLIENSKCILKCNAMWKIKLSYVNKAKNTIMRAKDFVINFHKLRNQQLLGYPNNLITQLVLMYRTNTICEINIDDYLEDYIVFNYPPANNSLPTINDEVMQYNRNSTGYCCSSAGIIIFAALAVATVPLTAWYGITGEDHIFFLVMITAFLLTASFMTLRMLYACRMGRAVVNDYRAFLNGGSNLADIILYMVTRRAVICSIEQKTLVTKSLKDTVPPEIVREIVSYLLGNILPIVNNFFDIAEQKKLCLYFNNKQYRPNVKKNIKCDAQTALLLPVPRGV